MSLHTVVLRRYREPNNPLRSQRRVEAGVLVLALLLLLTIIYNALRLSLVAPPAPVSPAADIFSGGDVRGLEQVDAGHSAHMRDRPVFWASRRPEQLDLDDAGDAAEQGEKPGEIKGIKLLGVFGSGDTAGVITLVEGKKRRILLGESLKGWTLDDVEADKVGFHSGDRREEVRLLPRKVAAATSEPEAQGKQAAGKKKKSETKLKQKQKQDRAAEITVNQAPSIPSRLRLQRLVDDD